MDKKEIFEILSKQEKFRLNYHLMPSKGLLNDPNGLIEKNGEYHIFYQWNDMECAHGPKKWGHYTTKDFINWEIKNVALNPENYYETHGCYSGSAILIENKINIIYTGNVKDKNDSRKSYQCLAIENDDGSFEKKGPVMNSIPNGYTAHFRDPKIWKNNLDYFMVLGAQNINNYGEVLLFQSKNLDKWNFIKSIYTKKDLGYMIECPDLFEINNKQILLCSPQGIESKEDLYNNLYQSGYMFGKIDLLSGESQWNNFIEIDRGFDFYAPQTFQDNKNRRIMYGWMGMEEEGHPTIEKESWVHALTMPRELKIKDNKLIQQPLEEFKNLRISKREFENIEIKNFLSLKEIQGNSYELIVEFEKIDTSDFGIKLRKNLKEELIVKFENEKLIVDRNKTHYLKGIRKCKIRENFYKLHIFMDKSSMELFYNDGEEVFTSRIFFDKDANEIEFFSNNGKTLLKKLEFYELSHFNYFI